MSLVDFLRRPLESSVRIEKIDPRTTPEWDTFVAAHPEATVFHTTAWARVLTDTYGYKPSYIVSPRKAARSQPACR